MTSQRMAKATYAVAHVAALARLKRAKSFRQILWSKLELRASRKN
jgi:hypothetical protein